MFNRSIIELSLDSWTWHLPNFERADKPGSTPGDAVFCFFVPCFFFFFFFLLAFFFFILTALLTLWFQKLLICILAKLTTRKKHKLSRHVPPLKQLNFFQYFLANIMTNNTQYTTNCTYLHPTPTSDQQAKVKPVPLYIVLIINIVTLKSPLGQLPQKTIKRNLLLVFGI